MNEYETLFIVKSQVADPERDELNGKFESIIKKNDGGVLFNRSLGSRRLAYPIEKQKDGYYTCLRYVAKGPAVSDIEKVMRYDERVLRFMTVRKGVGVDFQKRLTEVQAKGEDKEPIETNQNFDASFDDDFDDDNI